MGTELKKGFAKISQSLEFSLAERVGFEPTVPCGTIDFEFFPQQIFSF